MTPAEVLREARNAGMTVSVARSGNPYVEPAERLVPELRALLAAHKAELLDHLRRAKAANDLAPDPDRWCWPNDPSIGAAINTAEIVMFVRRHTRLLAPGFTDVEADRMADTLKLRGREVDDRVSCAECRHVKTQDGTYPGGHPLPMTMLHRCGRMLPTGVEEAEDEVDLEGAAPSASPSDDLEPW